MRKVLSLILALAMLLGCTALAENPTLNLADDRYATSEQVVAVTATADAINTVKSGIFGVNQRYPEGAFGILNEETHTFDETRLEMIRNSGVTHLRIPGGIEGDYIHWNESIGPVDERIPQVYCWDGSSFVLTFGPEEWIELCKLTGTSLTVQLNAGNGTPQEAVDFIRYCLDSGVEIESIAVGNEVHMEEELVEGIHVTKTPEEYLAFYNEVLVLMGEELIAELDAKSIPFGCIGLPRSHALSYHRKWDDTVLPGVNVPADFIDIHIAYSPYAVADVITAPREQLHKALLASHVYVKKLLDMEVATIEKYSPDTMIKMTEFGPMSVGSSISNENDAYGSAGCLFLASCLQVMIAEPKVISADYLPLCYIPQVTNALFGAHDGSQTYWVTSVGHVFKMYSEQIGREVLSVTIENSRTFKSQATGLIPRQLNVPEGEGAVYFDPTTGEGSLILINRAYSDNTVFDVTLPYANAKITKVTELWNENYSVNNTVADPDVLAPVELPFDVQPIDGKITVATKPVSLVKIDFVIE